MKGNFKVRCTKNNIFTEGHLTIGKIYEFKNGQAKWDDSLSCTDYIDYQNFCERNPDWGKCLELVGDNQTIVVYRKDREVIASLKDGKKVVKSAKAICNPSDTFDFEIGAKLAVGRLLEESVDSKEFEKVVKVEKTYHIVKQDEYEAGDKVKVREDLKVDDCMPTTRVRESMQALHGRIVTISKMSDFGNGKFHVKEDEDHWFWTPEMIEGKVIEDIVKKPAPSKPTVKEAKRHAKTGEYIKVTSMQDPNAKGRYELDEILRVADDCNNNWSTWSGIGVVYYHPKCNVYVIRDTDYVVLEGYVPEDKPTVNEVHRPAKVGEWIEVISSNRYYSVGDITKVYSIGIDAVFTEKDNEHCIHNIRYNVLENYQPEEPKPMPSSVDVKPFVKAKVGDKIRVVKNNGFHTPTVHIGDIQEVDMISSISNGVGTKQGNLFYDSQEEYIIIEEAPTKPIEPTKPEVVKQPKVGDKIKIIKLSGDDRFKLGEVYEVMGIREQDIFVKHPRGMQYGTGWAVIYDSEKYVAIEDINPLSTYTQEELMRELFNRQGL